MVMRGTGKPTQQENSRSFLTKSETSIKPAENSLIRRPHGSALRISACVGVDKEIAAFVQQNCGRSMRIMKICRKRGVRVVSRTKEPKDGIGKTC